MSDEEYAAEPRTRVDRAGSHYQPSPQLAFVLLVLFVVSVFAVLHYVSPVAVGGGAINSVTTTTKPHHSGTTTTLPKTEVKVLVANGTNINHLATTYNDTLQAKAWAVLGPVNGDLHPRATIVYYRPGFEWAAKEIAKTILMPANSVRPLGKAQPVKGSITGVDVIVLLGLNAET